MRWSHPEIPLPPDLVPRTAKIANSPSLTETSTASREALNQSLAPAHPKKRKRKPTDHLAGKEASEDDEEEVSVRDDPKTAKSAYEVVLMTNSIGHTAQTEDDQGGQRVGNAIREFGKRGREAAKAVGKVV